MLITLSWSVGGFLPVCVVRLKVRLFDVVAHSVEDALDNGLGEWLG